MTHPYIVLGCHPWNRAVYEERIVRLPGRWHYLGSPGELTPEAVAAVEPRYLFFQHWSWKVPEAIVNRYECVGFHPTDLPYGRGGTPVQNLIQRGFRETKLSAFRMTAEMDAGPVYLKKPLSLEGSAREIYERINREAAAMIQTLLEEEPAPVPQKGEPVFFKRRKPEESEITEFGSAEKLYDFIRMLDADGYPKAFVTGGGSRFEFSSAVLNNGLLSAKISIHSC